MPLSKCRIRRSDTFRHGKRSVDHCLLLFQDDTTSSEENRIVGDVLMTTLSPSAAARHFRIIRLVALRELTVQSKYRNKFFVDVFSHFLGVLPILLITIAMSGSSLDGGSLSDITATRTVFVLLGFIAFLAFGFGTPIMLYSGMGWGISTEVTAGTLERNFLAPVPRHNIVLGLGLYYVILYAFHVMSLLLLAIFVFGDEMSLTSSGLITALATVIGLLFLSTGMGLFSAGIFLLVRDTSFFQILVHRPFMILSGAIFVLDLLPTPIRFLARLNPLTYGIDAFRGSLSGTTTFFSPWIEIGIVFGASVALMIIGALFMNAVIRHQMRTGELTSY